MVIVVATNSCRSSLSSENTTQDIQRERYVDWRVSRPRRLPWIHRNSWNTASWVRPTSLTGGAAYSVRHTRCGILGAAYSVRHAAYSVRHTRCGILGAAYSVRHTRCGILGAAYSVRHTRCGILGDQIVCNVFLWLPGGSWQGISFPLDQILTILK